MGLEQQIVLRTARMGGFVKEDVLAYVDELNSKIYALEEEKSALQKKLETGGMSDKEKTSYEEELARLRGELGTTKNQLRAAQDELKKRPVIDGSGEGGASAEELEAVQAELADARTKIESMSSELTDTQAELNAAKAEIEMAQENAAEQAKKIEDLNADNEQLRQDLSQAVAQSLMGGADDDAKATLSAELVDLQQKNAELQAKLNDTAEEAASLKAELEAKDSMFAEQANLSNESDLKRLAEYEAQIADLQHSLAEKQQEIDAQAQQIVELQENSTDIGSGMSALFLEAQQTTNRLKAEAKKGFRMPHVFIILLAIMLLIVILSYLIPSGLYERIEDSATGMTVIDPDTFSYVENETPITFMDYFEAIYTGFVNGATIMGTLFISSGMIYILEASGAFGAGISAILKKTKGKEFSVVCIFYTIFVIFGVLGYGEAAYPFYPLAVTIGFALGYDRMVGTGLAIIGSTVGFTSGLMNTFTTGVAQQIVGLPLFSGIGFRAVGLVVFYVIGLVSLYIYCRKIRKNPEASLVKDEYLNQRKEDHTADMGEMNLPRALGLIVFLGTIIIQGYGCIRLGWSFPQIAAIYVIMGMLLALIFRIGPSEACQMFCQGAVRVFAAAFAVGMAQAVVVLMNQACIMDTIVHGMAVLLENKSAILALLIIFVFVTLFNFLVVSGSGKAVIVMPILQPLGEILHINQQVLVLAYQYGDGITNSFWPGSSLVQLSMCGVDYGSWIKFCWKTYLSFIVSAFVLVIIAYAIGYGPF